MVSAHNILSFVARHASVDVHYHQCFQLVVSMQAPFDSVIGGNSYEEIRGFLVNQGITHTCKAQNTELLIYFIDAETYPGWQLKEILNGQPHVLIESVLTGDELRQTTEQYRQAASLADLRRTGDDLMNKVLPFQRETANRAIDDRIIKAICFIGANLDNPLALEDIAGQVYLSPERLRHLFVQETGIPFSQFVLWKRIKLVLQQVLKANQSMASAAIQNGFTDQAHFTRLFRRTFGVNPGKVLKNSRSVQFLSP